MHNKNLKVLASLVLLFTGTWVACSKKKDSDEAANAPQLIPHKATSGSSSFRKAPRYQTRI